MRYELEWYEGLPDRPGIFLYKGQPNIRYPDHVEFDVLKVARGSDGRLAFYSGSRFLYREEVGEIYYMDIGDIQYNSPQIKEK